MYQHVHDYVEIMYIRSGSLTYNINFNDYELGAGDVIFVFPGQVHGHSASDDVDNFALLFPKNLPIYDSAFCNMLPSDPVIHGAVSEEVEQLFENAVNANTKDKSVYRKGITQGYISLILGKLLPLLELYQPTQNDSTTAEIRLIEYCSAHYTEPLTLTKVAKELGYSPTHLSHMFTKKFKMGFSQLICAMRIDDAKKLLRGNTKITQIALDCGFTSIRNFNRVFKEATGKTPSQYRKEKL